MKLSILKWVYDLGYKKAEDRYYYALMEVIRDRRSTNYAYSKRINETDKEFNRRMLESDKFFSELQAIVNNAFYPQEQVEVQLKDRFLP